MESDHELNSAAQGIKTLLIPSFFCFTLSWLLREFFFPLRLDIIENESMSSRRNACVSY